VALRAAPPCLVDAHLSPAYRRDSSNLSGDKGHQSDVEEGERKVIREGEENRWQAKWKKKNSAKSLYNAALLAA